MATIEEIMQYGNNRENFDKLVDLCIGEHVVPYIGAGLSDFANKKDGFSDKFYTWWKYLSIHYEACFNKELADNADLYKTADQIEEAEGQDNFHENIRITYGGDLTDDKWDVILDKAKEEAISVIPVLFNGPIITTNFDQILEKIHNPSLPVYLPHEAEALKKMKNVVKGRKHSIYKVHGSVSDVNQIVFTGKSYDKAYQPDSELVKTLSDFYKGFCFLFLGSSLKMSEKEIDKSIKLWAQLTNTGMFHFAILEEPSDFETRQGELQKQNIKPIFFPKGQFDTIKIILSEIIKRKKSVFGKIPEYKSEFVGRRIILDEIEKHFENSNYSFFALTGTGGVGKTRIMREYAYEKQKTQSYKDIVWFNAVSKDSVHAGIYQFAEKEKLINENVNEKPEEIFKKVKDWMAKNDDWLFLLDNVEDYKDIEELLSIESDVAKNGKRHFFITSRKTRFPFIHKAVDIFAEKESQDFLQSYTNIETNEFSEKIAEKLGHLPLALEQAAAYIKTNNVDYQDYFNELEKSLEILKQGDTEGRALSVEATWNISMRMIESEESRQLLNLCAFFAPVNIHCSWFREASEQLHLYPSLQGKIKNEEEYKKILDELADYSLVRLENDKISIHRLTQEAIKNSLKNEEELIEICVQIMDKQRFYDYSTLKFHNDFMEMSEHIIMILKEYKKETVENAGLYHFLGRGFYELGDYSQALKWHNKALAIREKILDKEHLDTATTYHSIGATYGKQGNHDRASEYKEKAKVIREKVLGKMHPDTAATYNNIAENYRVQSDYEYALEYYGKALDIFEKYLGIAHPNTAFVCNNIGEIYFEQGNYDSALEYHKKALNIREKVLGKAHPDTATTYNNMAVVYDAQGDYDYALEYYEKSLNIREKVLGKTHPNTATTYNNLGVFFNNQGNYDHALDYYKKSFAIRKETLGEAHPRTKVTLNNMKTTYKASGKPEPFEEWLKNQMK